MLVGPSATRPARRAVHGTPRQIAGRPAITETLSRDPADLHGWRSRSPSGASVFNIGVEGQFILGAFGASVAAIALKEQPAPLILVVATITGVLTGAFWGFIPGFLKAKAGAHEVITTIMLNYVAAQVVLFGLRSDFLRQEGSSQPISKVIADFVRVPLILDLGPGTALRLHWGFVLALIMAAIVSWFLFRTTKGYELRASGFNMNAARYAGMSASGSIILAMTISGGSGGARRLDGGPRHRPQMSNDISSGFGFNAIALACSPVTGRSASSWRRSVRRAPTGRR
jgi:simple sugar transport system permease protein